MQPCMFDSDGKPVDNWLPRMQTKRFLREAIARGERTADCWAELTRRNRAEAQSLSCGCEDSGEPDLPEETSTVLDHKTVGYEEYTLVALCDPWGEWTHQIRHYVRDAAAYGSPGQRLQIGSANYICVFHALRVFDRLTRDG